MRSFLRVTATEPAVSGSIENYQFRPTGHLNFIPGRDGENYTVSLNGKKLYSGMKIPLRTKIGHYLKTLRLPAYEPRPLSIKANGSGIQSLLVILPDQLDEFRVARHYFKSIKETHPGIRFGFIVLSEILSDHHQPDPDRIITITRNDLDAWLLPRDALLMKIFTTPFDAVINLNFSGNLIAEYIVARSSCAIRAGYSQSGDSRVYNLLIERKGRVALEKTYIQIQRILGL